LGNNPTLSIFPQVEFEQEVTYEDSKPNFASASSSPKTHTRLSFAYHREEFSETCRITCAYTKLFGKLPTTSKLPRRKSSRVERPKIDPCFYLDSIDNLIETSLHEVPGPLSRVAHFLVELEDELEGEHP
jgi:hypothetical protein